MQRNAPVTLGIVALAILMLTGGCAAPDGSPRYTVLLTVLKNPQYHIEDAKYYKSQTEQETDWDDLFIVHEHDHSKLYLGHFVSQSQAREQMLAARRFRTARGVAVFARASVVPLPGEDMGPPEWILGTNSEDIRYTLVVAQFHDEPEADYTGREHLAVKYCRQLREEGYQAYVHHAGVKSYVTIGDFPESAYQMMTANRTAQPFANRGQAVAVITDPQLQQLTEEFPDLAINGRQSILRTRDAVTGEVTEEAEPSFIMEIPRKRPFYGSGL